MEPRAKRQKRADDGAPSVGGGVGAGGACSRRDCAPADASAAVQGPVWAELRRALLTQSGATGNAVSHDGRAFSLTKLKVAPASHNGRRKRTQAAEYAELLMGWCYSGRGGPPGSAGGRLHALSAHQLHVRPAVASGRVPSPGQRPSGTSSRRARPSKVG